MHPHAQSPERYFWHYVIPAIASQLLTGFFIIVDGFFIGQKLGDDGLAAINLLWPLAAVILATGLGLGSGGAVLVSTALGRRDMLGAQRAQASTVAALLTACILLTAALYSGFPGLLAALGAYGSLYDMAYCYLQVACTLCFGQILNSGLNPLLRAMGHTVAAMGITIYSLLANIALDWLFIIQWEWGMAGAALATVIAQITSSLLSVLCLCSSKILPLRLGWSMLDAKLMARCSLIALSPFGLSLSSSLLIMLNNWQCLAYGGAPAVAAFAVVSYLLGSLQPILTGIGEGIQPLIGFAHGASCMQSVRRLLHRALRLMLLTGTGLCLASLILYRQIPLLFGASPAAAQLARRAVICAALSLPFWGIVRLFSSFFYTCGRTRLSLLFIYGDPLLISPLCLWALPLAWGLDGVWLAAPVAQLILTAGLGVLTACGTAK